MESNYSVDLYALFHCDFFDDDFWLMSFEKIGKFVHYSEPIFFIHEFFFFHLEELLKLLTAFYLNCIFNSGN